MPSFSRRRAIDWWKGGAVLWWDMCDGRRSGKGSPCGAVRWETGRCACWRAVGGWIGGYSAGCGRRRRPWPTPGCGMRRHRRSGRRCCFPFGSRPRWRCGGPCWGSWWTAPAGSWDSAGHRPVWCCGPSRPDGAVTEAADLLARRVRYLSPQLGRGQEELRRSLRHRYGLGEGGPVAQLAVCFGAAAEGLPSLLIGESHQEVRYVWAEPWWEKMKPWAAEEPLLAALLAEGSLPPGAAVPVWVGLDTGGERTYNAE